MEKDEVKSFITQSLFLLMKSCTYEKITMLMIAKRAGVSRRTVYRYFENKNAILNEYFNDLINVYKRKLEYNIKENKNVILLSFEFIFENSNFFKLAYKNNLLLNIYSAIEDIVKEIVSYNNEDLKNWNNEYLDFYVSFVAGGSNKIFDRWLNEDVIKEPNEIFEIYKNVICDLDKRISNVWKILSG